MARTTPVKQVKHFFSSSYINSHKHFLLSLRPTNLMMSQSESSCVRPISQTIHACLRLFSFSLQSSVCNPIPVSLTSFTQIPLKKIKKKKGNRVWTNSIALALLSQKTRVFLTFPGSIFLRVIKKWIYMKQYYSSLTSRLVKSLSHVIYNRKETTGTENIQ